jgi:hypothetical protein
MAFEQTTATRILHVSIDVVDGVHWYQIDLLTRNQMTDQFKHKILRVQPKEMILMCKEVLKKLEGAKDDKD